ncbi:cobalamin biosynthesis protein CobW [Maritalea mediterranea]|uniref:Cobalamin biosynthesis protein CobW n=1 Tax=Maritalea mediterranea TaxID=2909667 RepID=A0ABS9E3N2_9HYPH|nr:cobalamin biosynthesis protein CobW [Maritalea mediterranea]MCF4097393.1 cobalamin biosynthesis protein CobW [Maritalea mediterranea]
MKKIPATVITGFLGAGKTTLVRHVLNNAKGKRIALIINEFGDVGVDRDVLQGCGDEACSETDMVELANGCICCTVAEDFIPTITALLQSDNRPDHIVIETSGLALPQPLVRAFNWPEIKADVTVDGVVTVADASALAAGRFASNEAAVDAQRLQDEMLDHETPLGELFEDQLICADLVLLNKSDLVSPDDLEKVEAAIRKELRDGVKLVRTHKGEIDMAALLGIEAGSELDMDGRKSHHEHHHEDGHHHHEHDDFDSFSIRLPAATDKVQLGNAISNVIKDFDILRLKGFAAIKDAPARLSVQAVGPRVDTYFDRPWTSDEEKQTSLVVIGQSPLDRAAISERLEKAFS